MGLAGRHLKKRKPMFIHEQLEDRVFLSVTTINWNGQQRQVTAGKFVAVANTGKDFVALATKSGFTNITSLGDSEYSFESNKTASQIKSWGSNHSATVKMVEPDFLYQLNFVPNDPFFPAQWALQNTGQLVPDTDLVPPTGNDLTTPTNGTPGDDIKAPQAWDALNAMGVSGKKSVIAVLDSGVDINHPDLAGNIFTNPQEASGITNSDDDHNGFVDDVHGWNFFDNNNDVSDGFGHGTMVSGIIDAQTNNGVGIAGVANNLTDILPLKVGNASGFVSDSSVLAAINYAVQMKRLYQSSGGTAGANIIAMNGSFGGQTFPFDRISARAISRAGDADILFVVAAGENQSGAGNGSGSVNSGLQDFPSKFSLNLSNVITVTATDNNDQLASFANFGAGIQVAAPGVQILSTIPHFPETTVTILTPTNVEVGDTFTVNVTGDTSGSVSYTAAQPTPFDVAAGLAANWNVPGITAIDLGSTLELIPDTGINDTITTATVNGGTADTQTLAISTTTIPETTTTATAGTLLAPGFDYDFGDGTSFAAPMATGILALEYAARPTASAAQLKEALLRGVDKIPSLTSKYNVPPLVETGGRVDAYNSVRDILNEPVRNDTVRQGNWTGVYGSQGAFVAGDSTSLPSFVNANLSGINIVTPFPATTDVRALQRPSNPAERVVGYLEDPNQISFNLDFTDNQTHRVSFYVDDFEKAKRSELFEIVDRATGNVISSQVVSNFTNGEYLTYDLTGGITIRITKLSGPNAVLSGMFFDPAPVDEAAFVRADTTTSGNYTGVYGSEGVYVLGDVHSLPPGTTVTASGESEVVVKRSTSDKRALDLASNPSKGVVDYWTAPFQFNVGVKFADPTTQVLDTSPHRVSLYFVDFDKKNRAERVDVIDNTTGNILTSQDVTNFKNGEYLTFDVSGNVSFRITNLRGPSAVVSGIFIDGVPGQQVSYVAQDTTTQGTWIGKYGSQGAVVVGASNGSPNFIGPVLSAGANANSGPNLATELSAGATTQILSFATKDKRALQSPTNPTNRVVGYYAGSDFTLNLPINDTVPHRVSFYFVDFDKKNRVEQFQIIDPATGKVLESRVLSNFKNGIYLTYDITGPVQIRLTRFNGPSAVLSGVFFD